MCLPFDCCVFIGADYKNFVVVYVNDIPTAGLRSDITRLIDHLRSVFQVTVNSSHQSSLSIAIAHTSMACNSHDNNTSLTFAHISDLRTVNLNLCTLTNKPA